MKGVESAFFTTSPYLPRTTGRSTDNSTGQCTILLVLLHVWRCAQLFAAKKFKKEAPRDDANGTGASSSDESADRGALAALVLVVVDADNGLFDLAFRFARILHWRRGGLDGRPDEPHAPARTGP